MTTSRSNCKPQISQDMDVTTDTKNTHGEMGHVGRLKRHHTQKRQNAAEAN